MWRESRCRRIVRLARPSHQYSGYRPKFGKRFNRRPPIPSRVGFHRGAAGPPCVHCHRADRLQAQIGLRVGALASRNWCTISSYELPLKAVPAPVTTAVLSGGVGQRRRPARCRGRVSIVSVPGRSAADVVPSIATVLRCSLRVRSPNTAATSMARPKNHRCPSRRGTVSGLVRALFGVSPLLCRPVGRIQGRRYAVLRGWPPWPNSWAEWSSATESCHHQFARLRRSDHRTNDRRLARSSSPPPGAAG